MKMKKLLSILLITVMMLSVVSTSVFANTLTPTATYTNIVPVAGDTKTTTCTDSDDDDEYEVTLVGTDSYPGFKFDLNGSTETKYATADGGYLLVSYTVVFNTPTSGKVIVRPANNGNSDANASALAAGEYKFSYIYDVANSTIYPYINGVASNSKTYTLPAAGTFDTHRFMPTIKNISANTVVMTVSGIKTEEYASGEGVLAALQEAVVKNDTPAAPEHPGGSEKLNLIPTDVLATTLSGNKFVMTLSGDATYGKFAFNFGEDIKFDQSAETAEVDYIRFHTTLSSDIAAANLFIRPHSSGTQLVGTGALCQMKNAGNAYDIDMIVDLANQTCDYYVNGVHITTNNATGTSINQARFWLYNAKDSTTNITFSDTYVEKYYAKNPVYTSYAALKAACNTKVVDLEYAVATYDSVEEKYVLSTQMIGVDQENHYNIVAGYDANDTLVFAQKYWPNPAQTVDIPTEAVSYIKAFSWVNGTLKPLMSPVDVTIK